MTGAYLTKKQAAQRLNVCTRMIERYVAQRVLAVYRLPSGRMRFRPEDLDAFVAPPPAVRQDRPTAGPAPEKAPQDDPLAWIRGKIAMSIIRGNTRLELAAPPKPGTPAAKPELPPAKGVRAKR